MSLQSRYIYVNGIKTNFITGGQGDAILAIHGFPRSFDRKNLLLKKLSTKFHVFGLNLPCFGITDRMDNMSIKKLVDFIDKFTETIELEKFHLVGFSLGGYLSLNYAYRHQNKIKNMIIFASPFGKGSFNLKTKLVLSTLVGMQKRNPNTHQMIKKIMRNSKLYKSLHKIFVGLDPALESEVKMQTKIFKRIEASDIINLFLDISRTNLFNFCKKIKTKTLIVAANKDGLITLKSQKKLSKIMKNSKLIVVKAKHWNLIENTKLDELVKFLKNDST